MALRKLKAMHAALEQSQLMMPERFNSWMEDGKLIPANKNLGSDQFLIGRLQYDAVFEFEGFTGEPALLMAAVCAWLVDHDDSRDDDGLPSPDIDVDMFDDNTALVEVRVRFMEDIEMVLDPRGSIAMNGMLWTLTPSSTFDADTVGVGDDQSEPTDLPYTREDQP